jgi:hypothetical protein
MAKLAVTRITRNGPGGKGLEPCQFISPESVIAGKVKEKAHNFFSDASGQLSAGVWECSPCTLRLDGYSVDEYCHILTGRVVLTDEDGKRQSFGPGQSFVVPKGFRGTWHMPTTTRKYYVIFDGKK